MDTERKVDVLAWQPIDTAPRNGMPILLWAEVDGGDIGCGFTAVRASWHTSEGEHDIFGSEGGWLVSFTMGSNICSAEGATHWMPLPAKPGSK